MFKAQSNGVEMEKLRTLDQIVSVKLSEELNQQRSTEEDQCRLCRIVDCDVLFALLMIFVIFGLLVMVVVYWVKGIVASYEQNSNL